MTKQTSPSGTAAWLLLSAGLCATIVFQLNNDNFIAVPVTAAPADSSVEITDSNLVDSIAGPDMAVLDAIVDRPLFSASRQPFEAPIDQASDEAPSAMASLPFQLAGTMLSDNARFALLVHPEKGMLRLREGQDVDGWRVEDVDVNEVLLTNGDERMRLWLQKVSPAVSLERPPTAAGSGLDAGNLEAVESQKK